MTTFDRVIASIIVGTGAVVGIAALLFIAPRDIAIRNQLTIAGLLARAHRGLAGSSTGEIVLGDKAVLIPEREKVVAGYVLKAHNSGANFTIEARPETPGKTGLYTYFRDSSGTIRFADGVKAADADSRPLVDHAGGQH